MKLLAPRYYKEFVCIADRCSHSCCIGWEIDIDGDALEKYESLSDGYGENIRKSIEWEDCPHFALCENDRCPHLDERGLCRIISELGEEYLCDICREHPRFYNTTARGIEAGLGLSCEEAARLILSSDEYAEMIVIGESESFERVDFDSFSLRDELYAVLSNKNIPYTCRLEEICERFEVSLTKNDDVLWREVIDSLEFLEESHKEMFSCYSSDIETPAEHEVALERALAYFVYRHTGGAENVDEWRAGLGFSLFCERLLCSLLKTIEDISAFDAARIISEELEYSEDNTEAIKLEFMF